MKPMVLLCGILIALVQSPASGQEDSTASEQVEELKGAVSGLSDSFAEYRGFVDALRKIKVSGYIQTQFRSTELDNAPYTIGNFSGGAFPANAKGMFQVRRGRLKVAYDNSLSQYVLQIDVTQNGVGIKDAYIMLTEPWTKSFGLQAGIFNRPFGYEISFSSGSRETPERARVIQTLFPGERELGAKLFYQPDSGPLNMLRVDLGIFNGSGSSANEFDNFKDVIGRVAVQLPFDEIGVAFDVGMSGYIGSFRSNSRYVYTMGNLSGGEPGFRVDSSLANIGDGQQRQYLGIDAQVYYDLPVLGGMILRAEYIFGTQPGTTTSSTSPTSQPTSSLYRRSVAGWYVNYIQNIGTANQLVLKYDFYDPNTKVTGADFTMVNSGGALGLNSADIRFSTLGVGWIHHWDDNVKFLLYYEMIANEKLSNLKGTPSPLSLYADDVRDNVLTLRMQYKF